MSIYLLFVRQRIVARLMLRSCKHSTQAKSDHDWNTNEDFFRFSRGRFVCDEDHNMTMRAVRFDMKRLAQIAAKSIGANECMHVEKCPEGMYNKTFLLTMDDGRQVIGKVPNPNAGLAHLTTASEVATMDYVRNVLETPAPQVHAWSSRADNEVGAEYIVMEKVPGIQLSQVWERMKLMEKVEIVKQLTRYQKKWLSATFTRIGSLYYPTDFVSTVSSEPLRSDALGGGLNDGHFTIGPANGRDWIDEGRSSLTCYRGPWTSALDFFRDVQKREVNAVKSASHLPTPIGMLCGPGVYQPTRKGKLAALDMAAHVLEYMVPIVPSILTFHLWHNDLHEENIFVDPATPTRITGIIDWQSTQIMPLFENTLDPGILDYDGPEIESLDQPILPDSFNQLSKLEKAAEIRLLNSKALLIAHRTLSHRNPALKTAYEFQESIAFHILKTTKRIFEIGEAHLQAIIMELESEWSELTTVQEAGNPPFPFGFSASSSEQKQKDFEAALKGMQMMDEIKQQLGDLWPEKGAVQAAHYDQTKELLREAKQAVMNELGLSNEEEMREFEKYWPFDD